MKQLLYGAARAICEYECRAETSRFLSTSSISVVDSEIERLVLHCVQIMKWLICYCGVDERVWVGFLFLWCINYKDLLGELRHKSLSIDLSVIYVYAILVLRDLMNSPLSRYSPIGRPVHPTLINIFTFGDGQSMHLS